MHVRAIILAAAMMLPAIAAPVPAPAPTSNISPIPVVERRNDFSIANLFRDLLKREATIETDAVEIRGAEAGGIKFGSTGGHRRDAEAEPIKFSTP
ncbi:hypothetical protein GT037_008469, partial [Alternaria burnsii]